MRCRVELSRRHPCLSLEEALALAEVGNCTAGMLGERAAEFVCQSCGVFHRAALARSINGRRVRKERPSLERLPRTLDHITARLMVNLARVTRGSKVWEPFVGSGAIAHEVERAGGYVVGSDTDLKALHVARRNTCGDLALSSATLPPLRGGFDAAVGDPPYGRLTKSSTTVRALLYAFLNAALSAVKPGGYIVFASPIYVDLPYLKSCAMYLHSGLYRVVYITRAG